MWTRELDIKVGREYSGMCLKYTYTVSDQCATQDSPSCRIPLIVILILHETNSVLSQSLFLCSHPISFMYILPHTWYGISCNVRGLELGRRIRCLTVEWQTVDWVTACEG